MCHNNKRSYHKLYLNYRIIGSLATEDFKEPLTKAGFFFFFNTSKDRKLTTYLNNTSTFNHLFKIHLRSTCSGPGQGQERKDKVNKT